MRFQLNEKSPLFTKNALFSMNLWLNFHPNYHHAFSSISRVTNFWKMHLIQQTTIIIHGTHNFIFPFETDCVKLIIINGSWLVECPILTGKYHWYFPGRYLKYVVYTETARSKNVSHIPAVRGFLSIQIAFQRPRYSF